MAIEIRVVRTGETGTVIGSKVVGQWLVERADGSVLAVSGDEKVQVVPPDWSLEPPEERPDA
jgi:hypothetical protein